MPSKRTQGCACLGEMWFLLGIGGAFLSPPKKKGEGGEEEVFSPLKVERGKGQYKGFFPSKREEGRGVGVFFLGVFFLLRFSSKRKVVCSP